MRSAARYPAPPPLAEPQVSIDTIPSGFGGTQATVRRMISLIREGAKDFYVRQRAIDVLFAIGVPPKDYLGEIRAIFRFVQGHLRYTRDPHQTEVLHSARRLLSLRAGDCDDHTILLGAMLKSIGHPVRIVLTGPDPKRPRLFSHVYLEAEHRGEWIPLDATMPHPPGWQPNAPTRMVVPLGHPAPARETAGALDAAKRLYRTFTAAAPDRTRVVKSPRVVPPVVVGLGELVGLIYRSDKWEPGVPKTYIHYMERRPLLAADPTGHRLFIVGGRYRITERGIEG